ncbi:ParD-like family protein [Rheinheimera sp.]|uniref:ParD-like family protein n=1 Tax=Rheinheimera sp. TaxID=1869214 RepID=UPI00307D5C16
MGIVKIADDLHQDLREASKAMARSVNAQAEYWIRLGMLAELYPQLTCHELQRLLLKRKSASLQELLDEFDPAEKH